VNKFFSGFSFKIIYFILLAFPYFVFIRVFWLELIIYEFPVIYNRFVYISVYIRPVNCFGLNVYKKSDVFTTNRFSEEAYNSSYFHGLLTI